ncbi:Ig-like domain-containing protein [Blautia sp. 1033sp1_1033st1_G9_1033SCRN_220408]|uniref:Ig-like domain-containing protein n=1 Tax=Blautia sp. 1033sp1_1033st1_G9_1033SCRN_220408 TaxID=3144490 RepID=UPI0034A5AFBD
MDGFQEILNTSPSSGFKVKSWKSNNTSIAKVSSSGKITAGKKTGKTTITVRSGKIKKKIAVVIK